MASIRKRNGRYPARITRKEKPEVARTFNTKAEALAWSRTIEGLSIRDTQIGHVEAERLTLP